LTEKSSAAAGRYRGNAGFPDPYRFLAACYAHMSLLDEARATIARLRAITPEVMVNYPPLNGRAV
jgi:hypothetical protein